MLIEAIEGATRVLGKSQGFFGLPIRDGTTTERVVGDTPCMVSAWSPTPDELERLNAGARVYLKVLGTVHPPVLLEVGEPPEAT